ncbi:MAG: KGK domain-containing protein [Nostoc sp.]|uniref:KGK domain-containing protein n=1 Tax=Nostoc sp. TaxID=1180 RepID=UPI002FF8139A
MNDPVILTGDEVISMDKGLSFVNAKLLKFGDMDKQINETLRTHVPNYTLWTGEVGNGVSAEVLCPGKAWQKGKLKLIVSYRVEFIPDEVAGLSSPLDDLRSQLNPE